MKTTELQEAKMCVLKRRRYGLPVALSVLVMALRSPVAAQTLDEANLNLSDVPRTHWAWHPINLLLRGSIVEGFEGDEFRGDKPVTRYECAVMVARFFDRVPTYSWESGRRQESQNSALFYTDVPVMHWSYHALKKVQLRTLLPSFSHSILRGETFIDRYEGAVIFAHLVALMDEETEQPNLSQTEALFLTANLYTDLDTNHWAANAVSKSSRCGITEGFDDGTFRGNSPLNRYQFATGLARIRERQRAVH